MQDACHGWFLAGYMQDAWSVDDLLIGGSVLVADMLDDMFQQQQPSSPDAFLFWPGGRVAKFCVGDSPG